MYIQCVDVVAVGLCLCTMSVALAAAALGHVRKDWWLLDRLSPVQMIMLDVPGLIPDPDLALQAPAPIVGEFCGLGVATLLVLGPVTATLHLPSTLEPPPVR